MSVINSAVVLITLTQPCWQLPRAALGTWGLLTPCHEEQNLSVMVPMPSLSPSLLLSLKPGHPCTELVNAAVGTYFSHPPNAHSITISAWLELSPTLQPYPRAQASPSLPAPAQHSDAMQLSIPSAGYDCGVGLWACMAAGWWSLGSPHCAQGPAWLPASSCQQGWSGRRSEEAVPDVE